MTPHHLSLSPPHNSLLLLFESPTNFMCRKFNPWDNSVERWDLEVIRSKDSSLMNGWCCDHGAGDFLSFMQSLSLSFSLALFHLPLWGTAARGSCQLWVPQTWSSQPPEINFCSVKLPSLRYCSHSTQWADTCCDPDSWAGSQPTTLCLPKCCTVICCSMKPSSISAPRPSSNVSVAIKLPRYLWKT